MGKAAALVNWSHKGRWKTEVDPESWKSGLWALRADSCKQESRINPVVVCIKVDSVRPSTPIQNCDSIRTRFLSGHHPYFSV